MSSSLQFSDKPIILPAGKKLVRFADAVAWLAKKVPKAASFERTMQAG